MTSNASVIAATVTRPESSEKVFDVSSGRDTTPSPSRRLGTRMRGAITSNGCLKVNVSGRVFELNLDHVNRYPDSLLANTTQLANYYQPSLGMIFFDRNRYVFEYIMQYYQGDGYMEFPEDIPAELLQIELKFFKIGYRNLLKAVEDVPEKSVTFCEKGREFFNDPHSSFVASIWMVLDIIFIVVSVLVFVLRTEPVILTFEEKHEYLTTVFLVITILCAIFFTVDLLGRWIFSKNRFTFFLAIMPWLDVVAIIPLYFEMFEQYLSNLDGNMINILKLFRMARVARCLKLIRRSKRLVLIFKILVECKEELSILLLVWVTGTAISGSIMFFVEESTNRRNFYSVLESCYWAVITIGTIGYGNVVPLTAIGKILTTIIIFCSMIFMTVPMTIIIRRFSDSFEKFERSRCDTKMIGYQPVVFPRSRRGSNTSIIYSNISADKLKVEAAVSEISQKCIVNDITYLDSEHPKKNDINNIIPFKSRFE